MALAPLLVPIIAATTFLLSHEDILLGIEQLTYNHITLKPTGVGKSYKSGTLGKLFKNYLLDIEDERNTFYWYKKINLDSSYTNPEKIKKYCKDQYSKKKFKNKDWNKVWLLCTLKDKAPERFKFEKGKLNKKDIWGLAPVTLNSDSYSMRLGGSKWGKQLLDTEDQKNKYFWRSNWKRYKKNKTGLTSPFWSIDQKSKLIEACKDSFSDVTVSADYWKDLWTYCSPTGQEPKELTSSLIREMSHKGQFIFFVQLSTRNQFSAQ